MYVRFCSVDQGEREGEKARLKSVGLLVGGYKWSGGFRIRTERHTCSIAMLMLLLMWGLVGRVLNFISALLHSSQLGEE